MLWTTDLPSLALRRSRTDIINRRTNGVLTSRADHSRWDLKNLNLFKTYHLSTTNPRVCGGRVVSHLPPRTFAQQRTAALVSAKGSSILTLLSFFRRAKATRVWTGSRDTMLWGSTSFRTSSQSSSGRKVWLTQMSIVCSIGHRTSAFVDLLRIISSKRTPSNPQTTVDNQKKSLLQRCPLC